MSPVPPKAYAARRFTPAVEAAMNARYAVTWNQTDSALTPGELAQAASGCDYLFVSPGQPLPAETIAALAPGLKVIATLSVGVDHIDLEAARRAGVKVLHTPDVLSEATAEIAMLLILGVARRASEGERMVRAGAWGGWAPTQLLGRRLTGRRLGLLGMGRIGKQVAARARAFGLEIHYHNRRPLPDPEAMGAIYHADSDRLLAHSDIFCITAPSVPELKNFLDARRIALLPADAMVVNVARGDLVDDDALIDALQNRRLFGAGLDVYRGEPAIDPRYRTLDNVMLLPHLGSATIETRDAMGFLLLEGLSVIEAGGRPGNQLV
jgi:lactate dehydrogenase-like 2-hydroxyacid dehydrogenase